MARVIYGNTAVQLEPKIKKERVKKPERLYEQRRKADRRYRASGMINRGYLCYLVLMTSVCAFVCLGMLHIQQQIVTRSSEITALQEEAEALAKENDAMQSRLNVSLTLPEVKERALALGMVAPSTEQIKYYHVTRDDYMFQTGDIK